MSYGVVRGSPVGAQLYLDKVIDDILETGRTRPGVHRREEVNLTEIMFHCMITNPDEVHMINGASNEKFTNKEILARAVSLARAMTAMSSTEMTVIMILRNHKHMAALYYAMFLAGVVPFMMEPNSTEYEIQHFLSLVTPRVVFCEGDHYDVVTKAVQESDIATDVVVADESSLNKFVQGHSDDFESFKLPNVDPGSTALLLPTSGSTGLPKAAKLTHRGLTLQLPGPWLNHKQFPRPSRLALVLSTGQWMTHTILMTSGPTFGVPVLISPKAVTTENVIELVEKYQSTWVFLGPALGASLGQIASAEQLSSLETLALCGSPFTVESVSHLKEKLSKPGVLLNIYGSTELHGMISMGDHTTPLTSVGKISNFIDYKLVDSDGEEILVPKQRGELYLRSKCLIKGYVKNEAAYHESVTDDGWLKTGDVFYCDEEGQLFFANRSKLGFECMDHPVNPEEIENVIGAIQGVQQCVVCGAEAVPAAAVVMLPGCDVTRERIHQAINSKLSDYKRLRGGIAFVQALPRTHNGKINRTKCLQLIKDLVSKGECY